MEAASKDIAAATARRRRAKRAYLILGVIAGIVAALWIVHRWWTAGKESTDDAQIEADVLPIAARVGGTVKAVRIHDNQLVNKGDVMYELDPAELDAEVARAEAELEAARASLSAADAQVAIVKSSSTGGLSSAKAALTGAGASVRGAGDAVRAADAAVARARADLTTATSELDRSKQLLERQAITKRDFDRTQQAYDVAKAALDSAIAQLDMARNQRNQAQARVAEAEGHVAQSAPVDEQVAAATAAQALAAARVKVADAALSRARLNRSYATIVAPTTGYVSKLAAHEGQAVVMGQMLLMLVPRDTYVIANFKETQIRAMKAGDKVDIELDAYPGTFKGVVDTISPATGARFSLLPPDNATGNFVKVVQRVPVKISWTVAPEIAVRPGLSAEVVVHVD